MTLADVFQSEDDRFIRAMTIFWKEIEKMGESVRSKEREEIENSGVSLRG